MSGLPELAYLLSGIAELRLAMEVESATKVFRVASLREYQTHRHARFVEFSNKVTLTKASRYMKTYNITRLKLALAAGSLFLVGLGCNTSLTLTASGLVVDPDSAWAGDNVQFNFTLTVIPARATHGPR